VPKRRPYAEALAEGNLVVATAKLTNLQVWQIARHEPLTHPIVFEPAVDRGVVFAVRFVGVEPQPVVYGMGVERHLQPEAKLKFGQDEWESALRMNELFKLVQEAFSCMSSQ